MVMSKMHRTHVGPAMVLYWTCVGAAVELPWSCNGCVEDAPDSCWSRNGVVLDLCWGCSGIAMGTLTRADALQSALKRGEGGGRRGGPAGAGGKDRAKGGPQISMGQRLGGECPGVSGPLRTI